MVEDSWDTERFPAADSYEYCYLYQISEDCDDIFGIPAKVRASLDNKESLISLKMDQDEEDENYYLIDMMMSDISSRVMFSEEYSNTSVMYNTAYLDDGGCLLTVALEYYDFGEDDPGYYDDVDDESYQKATDAVEDAFGDLTQQDMYSPDYETGFAYTTWR